MAAIPNEILLGKDCTFTIDGAELKGIVDVTITCEAETIDTSTRDDGGFSAKLPGMKSVSISLNLKRYKSGANAISQDALRTAWLAETPTGISVVTDKSLLALKGTFIITSLEESQGKDEAVTLSATLENYGEVTVTPAT